jgi:hypothetical protein
MTRAATAGQDRVPLYRAKIEHLEKLIADLDHDWERLPRLFVTTLVGLPVGLVYGLPWGFVSVVLACSFVGVVAYITGVRKRDYTEERDALRIEIAKAEASRTVP